MDTITQGIVGSALAGACAGKKDIRIAMAAGWIAGMAADADIFILSPNDPLFQVLIHRHFSHALVFIPIGSFICAWLMYLFFKKHLPFSKLFFYSLLGYATHGVLDACTSYGTHLLWPFRPDRVAWDNVSVIDPIFTLTVGASVFLAMRKRLPAMARAGIFLGICYLLLGAVARDHVAKTLYQTAAQRGHAVTRMRVMPTLGNIVLWRGIYESGNRFYMDGYRIGITGPDRLFPGTSVEKYALKGQADGQNPPNLMRDIHRFHFFSDGYISQLSQDPVILGDMRYAVLPNSHHPLWGIMWNGQQLNPRVRFHHFRRFDASQVRQFFEMLFIH